MIQEHYISINVLDKTRICLNISLPSRCKETLINRKQQKAWKNKTVCLIRVFLGTIWVPLEKLEHQLVATRCRAFWLGMLCDVLFWGGNGLSLWNRSRWHCAALTRSNPTNFSLCYLKLLLPAAILATVLDSGIGLETWVLLHSRAVCGQILQSSVPRDPTTASGPQRDQALTPGFPMEALEAKSCTDPHRTLSFLNSLVLLSSQSSRLHLADENLINIFNYQRGRRNRFPLFRKQQRFLEKMSFVVEF